MEQELQKDIKEKVHEILLSKMEELHMLGYDAVTTEEIWDCVTSKYKKEWPSFSQIVNDIYSLKPMALMNWMTLSAFQGKLFE